MTTDQVRNQKKFRIVNQVSGLELHLDSTVLDFRGELWYLRGGCLPLHPGSTGRVYLSKSLEDDELKWQSYYPVVINAVIKEVE